MKYKAFRERVQGLPVFASSLIGTLGPNSGNLKLQLSLWKKKGLVIPLRKGLYVLNPADRRMEPSPFYLANQMMIPSYVSLESALAYYGLVPEFVAALTSVTVRKTCRFENSFGLFTYQHVKPKAFTGFERIRESEKVPFLMAVPEKAVADFLYLNLSRFGPSDPSIFEASYRFQNCGNLDPKKLKMYAEKFQNQKLLAIVELFTKEVI